MIRFLVVWNVVLTVFLVVLLVGNRHDRLAKSPLQAGVQQAEVSRVRRVELVDREGHLTAVLGEGPDTFFPKVGLTLLDPHGRQAVNLGLNDRGYGFLSFQSSQAFGKVSVGYFSGGDEAVPPSKEDPTGMWGIRVLKPTSEAPQVFGVMESGQRIPTSR